MTEPTPAARQRNAIESWLANDELSRLRAIEVAAKAALANLFAPGVARELWLLEAVAPLLRALGARVESCCIRGATSKPLTIEIESVEGVAGEPVAAKQQPSATELSAILPWIMEEKKP